MKKHIYELGLLFITIIWGYGFVATYNSINSLSVYQTMFLRFTIASVLMFIIFFKNFKNIKKSTIKNGALTGLVLFLGFMLQTQGMVYTTGSKSAFLTGFNVILVPFITYVFWKRRLRRSEVIGAFIALLGITLISFNFDFTINIGDILTLACAVMFALQIIMTDVFVSGEDPIMFTLIQMIVCAVLGFISMKIFDNAIDFKNISNLYPVLYLGVFSTMLAYILQTICQRKVSETKSAILLSTESLWGSLFSILFLGEVLNTRMIFGGILMFISILLATLNFKGDKVI